MVNEGARGDLVESLGRRLYVVVRARERGRNCGLRRTGILEAKRGPTRPGPSHPAANVHPSSSVNRPYDG